VAAGARLKQDVAVGAKIDESNHTAGPHEESTIRLHEKGNKRRTIGLHYAAGSAIAEYIEMAGLASGPLFALGKARTLTSLRIDTSMK
jgi:site-specific recombinase XerC